MSQFSHRLKQTFAKDFLSLFYPPLCKGSKLHPAFVATETTGHMCRLRKALAGAGSPIRLPAAYPHAQEEKAEPSVGECLKYGFLEHDPHSEYRSSFCLMLPKWESGKVQRNRRPGGERFLCADRSSGCRCHLCLPSPPTLPFTDCSPSCLGRETAVPLSAAKLRCALWLMTIDFLPTTLPFDTPFQ